MLSSERKALQDELNRTQNTLTQRKAEIDDAAVALHRTQDLLTRAELRIESQAQEISALRSARDRRDTELSEITKSLAAARSDLTSAQAELARREAEMARLQTEHLALKSGLAESETTLAQRESDLARASGRLAEAEADVVRLAAQHGVLERKVQTQADEISALSASNAERDTELSEVAKIILEYQQGLEDARASADRQRSSIETARAALAETQGLLSQKFDLPAAGDSAATEDLADLLAALRRQVEDLAGTYEQTKEQLSAVSAHNDALVHSTSWRLTSPMRWIVRHLRRS
ncbi:Chromosome partition protein Smc [bioreactor metagenome]|uniref:Chromosome partition protein Smc n=1 Tax=bioreactor metagenome TaxID=1076179 RepID=A0A644U9F9_9ZZZZ